MKNTEIYVLILFDTLDQFLKMNVVGLEKINKASNLHKSFTESLDNIQPVCGRHLMPLFTLYTGTETN